MRKIQLSAAAIAVLLVFNACKKSDNTSNAKTVQNLSGAYHLTGLTWTALGVNVNIYDSLEACEKDNIIQLNSDLSASFIDSGVPCDPLETEDGTWSLSANADSIYIGSDAAFIKSWDGKTLVVTNIVEDGPPVVTGTTTLVKQ